MVVVLQFVDLVDSSGSYTWSMSAGLFWLPDELWGSRIRFGVRTELNEHQSDEGEYVSLGWTVVWNGENHRGAPDVSALSRLVCCSRPPRRISPSSKKGLYHAVFDYLGSGKLFCSACSPLVKESLWATRIQYIRAAFNSAAVSSPEDISSKIFTLQNGLYT